MGDHYIPQFYLRGFAEPQQRRTICMYQKGTDVCVRTNVKNVAQQTDLYSRELESYFANALEGPTKPILARILGQQPVTDQQRDAFVTFLIAMLRRVPTRIDLVHEFIKQNAESVFLSVDTEIRALLKAHPDKKDILHRRLAELEVIRSQKRIDPKDVWHNLLLSTSMPNVSLALDNMSWTVFIAREDVFLTNDNPVFFFISRGVGRSNSEVSFPLTSRQALLLRWPRKRSIGYRYASERFITEINRRTASNAARYVFSALELNWIPKLINRQNIALHSIRS